ncbi:MAG: selenocysteine-specific translation elongation factor [SAR324 cluster bacterium]|nr:selenocysteine-specific translation elongation factor [SAR324 cluster bacterium]
MTEHTRNFVIGTSGHIDHGKTTLIKALTGIDTDRFAEEKKRGITIDLGFAHYADDSGIHLSFIDVPGHEKFVHNMLAGAASIDAVLLVIAADEGVMPQTREHLDICNLLKIHSGLIVLTRCDLVEDPDMLELCKEEIKELTTGTFLEQAPIVPVSAITETGLDSLREELKTLYQTLQPREHEQPLRFSVDRSFTMKGFGTVVTGTMLCGHLDKNVPVLQFPSQTPVRIRGLQVHGKAVEQVEAGQRAAINIANAAKEDIQRGDQLAHPSSLLNSYMLNVELHLLKTAPHPLRKRDRVRAYFGTREVMGRVIPLEKNEMECGQTQLVQLRLEQPISSRFGDRFIIRNFSPVFTLGGGRVIDPSPGKSRRIRAQLQERLELIREGDEQQATEQVIYLQSTQGVPLQELTVRKGFSEKQASKIVNTLSSQQKIFCINPVEKRFLHMDHLLRIGEFVGHLIKMFHQKFPEREGMTRAELMGKLSLLFKTEKEVDLLLKYLVKNKLLQENNQYYSIPGHQKIFSQDQQDYLQSCVGIIEKSGYQPPRQMHLLEKCDLNEKEGVTLLKIAVHDHLLVRVADDLYYTPKQIEEITSCLHQYFEQKSQLTVIDFKELLQISRKHAVDLLEYFDTKYLTSRIDNYRILRTST